MISKNSRNRILLMCFFVIVSLILFSFRLPRIYILTDTIYENIDNLDNIDPMMKDIYVPPVEDSHLTNYKNWNMLKNDNNIPGLRPGPILGDNLGLENNSVLSLSTPIRAPLVNN